MSMELQEYGWQCHAVQHICRKKMECECSLNAEWSQRDFALPSRIEYQIDGPWAAMGQARSVNMLKHKDVVCIVCRMDRGTKSIREIASMGRSCPTCCHASYDDGRCSIRTGGMPGIEARGQPACIGHISALSAY